jgi:hypothetical protein
MNFLWKTDNRLTGWRAALHASSANAARIAAIAAANPSPATDPPPPPGITLERDQPEPQRRRRFPAGLESRPAAAQGAEPVLDGRL